MSAGSWNSTDYHHRCYRTDKKLEVPFRDARLKSEVHDPFTDNGNILFFILYIFKYLVQISLMPNRPIKNRDKKLPAAPLPPTKTLASQHRIKAYSVIVRNLQTEPL